MYPFLSLARILLKMGNFNPSIMLLVTKAKNDQFDDWLWYKTKLLGNLLFHYAAFAKV